MPLALPLSLLLLLALTDGAFSGYRAAAGRDGRLHKRDFYGQAMGRGAAYALGASALAGLAAGLLLAVAPNPPLLLAALTHAAACLLQVYLPYAAVTVAAFAVRSVPSVDIRSAASALLFGPLDLLRPVVAIAGVLWAAEATRRPEVVLLGILVLTLMLSCEGLLSRFYARP